MTATRQVWDNTIVKSDQWIEELGEELGWDDPHLTLLALRSVLHALRDRLPPDEAVELAAQLPLLIKGLYFDGWDPSATPVKARSREEFYAMVRGPFQGGLLEADVERVTRAVFRVLAGHVSAGEVSDVRDVLPADLASLWPDRP